jgi:hypothetical protein
MCWYYAIEFCCLYSKAVVKAPAERAQTEALLLQVAWFHVSRALWRRIQVLASPKSLTSRLHISFLKKRIIFEFEGKHDLL